MVYTERDSLLDRQIVNQKIGYRKYFTGSVIGAVSLIASVVVLSLILPFNGNVQYLNSNEDEFVLQNSESTSPSSRSDPTVVTKLGNLKGVKLISRGGRSYFGFYNVPYAEPPLGDLRFQPPIPAKPWTGLRDATVKGSMCTQKSRYNPLVDVEGSEDCLHTNIFTPTIPSIFSRPKYPVIVYFFGGGFMHGTANDFSAAYFMDEDVIIVIVESRVGALGFLNTGDEYATGNQGLKDQTMALKWVQENIANFGGDESKVVAFGTSSGAMCSHSHLLSPMSKGLISGVMSFSGVITSPSMFSTNPRETALKFARSMNCSETTESQDILKCLRNASAHDIALNQPDFSPSLEYIPSNGNLTNVFYPDTPLNIMRAGKANNVPWLVGVNSAEAILQSYSLILDGNALKSLNENWNTFAPKLLALNHQNLTYLTDVVQNIRDFYFNDKTIEKNSTNRYNLTNLLSDRYYIHPTKVSGLLHSQQNNSVYWYYLTKEANISFADSVIKYFDPPYGVSHADEVQYTFFRERYPYIPLDWEEYADFSVMLIKFWVSFANTGTPVNPDPTGIQWPKVNPNDNGRIWYNLDDTPKLIEPFTERMEFWDSFPFDFLYNYEMK